MNTTQTQDHDNREAQPSSSLGWKARAKAYAYLASTMEKGDWAEEQITRAEGRKLALRFRREEAFCLRQARNEEREEAGGERGQP